MVNRLINEVDDFERARLIRKASFEIWLALMPVSEIRIQELITQAVVDVRAKRNELSHRGE